MVEKLQSREALPELKGKSHRKFPFARTLGIALNLLLVIGLLLLTARVIPLLEETLQSAATNLLTMSRAFDRISTTLSSSVAVLDSTSAALETASITIERSTGVIQSTSGIVGDVGDGLIASSQSALEGMESAAGAVDSTLDFLTALGLLNQDGEGPPDPLSESIRELSQVLDSWPEEFAGLSTSLNGISSDIEGITDSLDAIRDDLDRYQSELSALAAELEGLAAELDARSRELMLWAERVPVWGWVSFGALAVVLLVNTWIQIASLLDQRQQAPHHLGR